MPRQELGPSELEAVLRAYTGALYKAKETVNSLNVFPVPDGDTGTNMLATLDGIAEELVAAHEQKTAPLSMAEVCSAISKGSLMAARGNSGVILCQVLRGLCDALAQGPFIGPIELADALAAANEAARAAVLRPLEGTILTVAKGAAEEATNEASKAKDLLTVAEAARRGAKAALWSTPRLLEVLAEAGVVDAGGAGLLIFFDALLHVIDDRDIAELELPEEMTGRLESAALEGFDEQRPLLPGGLAFEVMYLLEAADEELSRFKDRWSEVGDSIVVVGGSGLYNCHIHTNDVGAAIEAGIDAGRPRDIKVSDLRDQVPEEAWVEQATAQLDQGRAPSRRTAVVAVASGEGIRRIFSSLGAERILVGGQSMNPSTNEMLEAIDGVGAEQVVVLSNNANIVPVALEAAKLSPKHVVVVPTKGVQEGFAALVAYDPDEAAEENLLAMTKAASNVVAGEVTRAVRAASSAAGPIDTGDFIGLSRSGIASIDTSLCGAACGLLESMLVPEHEIVTLIEGAGASATQVQGVIEWLEQVRPDLVVERHYGGQALYLLLVSIE